MRRSADPEPTERSVRRSALAVALMLVASASSRFVVRRRRTAAAARLAKVVARHRSEFVRVTFLAGPAFARWDDATNAYRTVAGVRLSIDGDATIAKAIPIEYDPTTLVPTDESRVALVAAPPATMWILARVAERRTEAGLRDGVVVPKTLEPILDRFVVVRDDNGPAAPSVYHPSALEVLLYPGALAIALFLFGFRQGDPTSTQAWLLAATMALAFVEFLGWVWLFTPKRPR